MVYMVYIVVNYQIIFGIVLINFRYFRKIKYINNSIKIAYI